MEYAYTVDFDLSVIKNPGVRKATKEFQVKPGASDVAKGEFRRSIPLLSTKNWKITKLLQYLGVKRSVRIFHRKTEFRINTLTLCTFF